jgi:hypothetical protein
MKQFGIEQKRAEEKKEELRLGIGSSKGHVS